MPVEHILDALYPISFAGRVSVLRPPPQWSNHPSSKNSLHINGVSGSEGFFKFLKLLVDKLAPVPGLHSPKSGHQALLVKLLLQSH